MLESTSNALKLEGSECGAEYKGHWSLFIYYIILSSEQGEIANSWSTKGCRLLRLWFGDTSEELAGSAYGVGESGGGLKDEGETVLEAVEAELFAVGL